MKTIAFFQPVMYKWIVFFNLCADQTIGCGS